MSTLVSTLAAVVLLVVIPALFSTAPERWRFNYVTRRPDPRTPVSPQCRRFGSALPEVGRMSGKLAIGDSQAGYWLAEVAAVHARPGQPYRRQQQGGRHE